ncbi:MAG: hypothetical protein JXM68_01360 [Sedimentisphaerales bacterium]|nr:hypothetical protein [Sedimentisphaerales bacterium]
MNLPVKCLITIITIITAVIGPYKPAFAADRSFCDQDSMEVNAKLLKELHQLYNTQETIWKDGVLSYQSDSFCKNIDIDQITSLAGSIRSNLFLNFMDFPELIVFFDNDQNFIEYCRDIFKETQSACRVYCLFIQDYYEYIDRYQDDLTWHTRFGNTGIYSQVKLLKQEAILFQVSCSYYQTALGLKNTCDNTKILQELLLNWYQTENTAFLLWYIKIAEIAGLKIDHLNFDNLLRQYLNEKRSYTDSLELSFLQLQLKHKHNIITTDKALEDINIIISNFSKLPDTALSDNLKLLLRATLFEASLCKQYLMSTGAADKQSLTSALGGCLETMWQRAQNFQIIKTRIRLIAVAKARIILESTDKTQWPQLLKSWNGNILLDLAASFQNESEPDIITALHIYQAIEAAGPNDQKAYASMLYQRAFCYLQQANSLTSKADKEVCRLNAAGDLVTLLAEFPALTTSLARTNDIYSTIVSICHINNWPTDRYHEIKKILEPLFGSNSNVLPEQIVYLYASLNELTENYKPAADLYSSLTDGELKHQAIIRRIFCLHKMPTATQTEQFYEVMIAPLLSLAHDDKIKPETRLQATELLAVVASDTPAEKEVYLSTISKTLANITPEKAGLLIKASQNFISRQEPQIRHLAAYGQTEKLSDLYDHLIPLATLAFTKAASPEEKLRCADLYAGLMIYKASCSAGVDQHTTIPKFSPDALTTFKLLAQENSINSYRASACLALSQKDLPVSRKHWQQIRQISSSSQDYFFWEARFWGIFCLTLEPEGKEKARHAITVLKTELASQPANKSIWQELWLERISKLEYNTPL